MKYRRSMMLPSPPPVGTAQQYAEAHAIIERSGVSRIGFNPHCPACVRPAPSHKRKRPIR